MIILLIVLLLWSVPHQVSAFSWGDIINFGKDFVNLSTSTNVGPISSNITDITKTVTNILTIAGMLISVVAAAILGIKIMYSSVEEKAEYKQKLMPYIIGCVVIFAASAIWRGIVTLLDSTF